MAHLRTQIRNQLKEIFLDLVLVDGRIFFDKITSITSDQLPCLIVNTRDENLEEAELGNNPNLQRTLQCFMIILVSDSSHGDDSNYQDTIDEILLDLEKKVYQNKKLNGLITSMKIKGTFINPEMEFLDEMATMNVTCEIKYRTRQSSPDIANP